MTRGRGGQGGGEVGVRVAVMERERGEGVEGQATTGKVEKRHDSLSEKEGAKEALCVCIIYFYHLSDYHLRFPLT